MDWARGLLGRGGRWCGRITSEVDWVRQHDRAFNGEEQCEEAEDGSFDLVARRHPATMADADVRSAVVLEDRPFTRGKRPSGVLGKASSLKEADYRGDESYRADGGQYQAHRAGVIIWMR
jgi:hypothetical protein